MKLEIEFTLEQLEDNYWGPPQYDSHLVKTCHALRQKPLKDFSVEDLRIMIGQNFSLNYLIPLAIIKLSKDILAEGDLFPGDLLTNLLRVNEIYWIQNKNDWDTVINLFKANYKKLEEFNIDEEIKQNWFDLFKQIEQINKPNANNN